MYTSHISKRTARQWKRAVYSDYTEVRAVKNDRSSFHAKMVQYFKPEYTEYTEVFDRFLTLQGCACISAEFSIYKATDNFEVYHLHQLIGTCTPDQILLDEGCEHFKEELAELTGGLNGTVRINRG